MILASEEHAVNGHVRNGSRDQTPHDDELSFQRRVRPRATNENAHIAEKLDTRFEFVPTTRRLEASTTCAHRTTSIRERRLAA
jgi:hypothetical protein